jgi:hypothetical protein
MNSASALEPALGNIIQVLADLGFDPLVICTNLENPHDPYYFCAADLDTQTGSTIRFEVSPASDEVVVRLRDGAEWPSSDGDPQETWDTEEASFYGSTYAFIRNGHWEYETDCGHDEFATYLDTLRTIDRFTARATFERHVDLALNAGTLSPKEADHCRMANWYVRGTYGQPLSPECHPFSLDMVTPPFGTKGGAS